MRPDEESLCADARKLPLKGRNAGVPKTVFGVQEMAARGSPAAHQLGNAGGSAIGRAISFSIPLKGTGSPSRTHPSGVISAGGAVGRRHAQKPVRCVQRWSRTLPMEW
jgi:hypothetical protein